MPTNILLILLIFCTAIFYWLGFFSRFSAGRWRIVWLSLACLAVALDGYFAVEKIGLDRSGPWAVAVEVAVLVIWILTGAAGRSRLIVAAAWSGIGLLYGLGIFFIRGVETSQYGLNSLYWLVFAGVSGGLAFFFGRAGLYVAPAWAVTGLLAVFVPEALYASSGAKPGFLVDVTAFLKISLVIAGLVAFWEVIRKWLDMCGQPAYNEPE